MKTIFQVSKNDDTSEYQVYVEQGVSLHEVMYGIGMMLRVFRDAELSDISTMLVDINRYATDPQFDPPIVDETEEEDNGLD